MDANCPRVQRGAADHAEAVVGAAGGKVGTTRSRVTFSLNKAGLHRVRRWRPAQDQLLAAERRVARM